MAYGLGGNNVPALSVSPFVSHWLDCALKSPKIQTTLHEFSSFWIEFSKVDINAVRSSEDCDGGRLLAPTMTRFPSIVHSIHVSSPPGECRSFLSLLGNFVSRATPPPYRQRSRRNTDKSFCAVIKLFGVALSRCVSVMAISFKCEQRRFDKSES